MAAARTSRTASSCAASGAGCCRVAHVTSIRTGLDLSVFIDPLSILVDAVAVRCPAFGVHLTKVFCTQVIKIIAFSINPLPSGHGHTFRSIGCSAEEIPFSCIVLPPAAAHLSFHAIGSCVHIVPASIDGDPSSHHPSGLRIQIIPAALGLDPSSLKRSVRSLIFPVLSFLNPGAGLYSGLRCRSG